MAQHGYLREFDEGRNSGDDRQRDRLGEDRDRDSMFRGGDSERREDHHGAFERWGDNARQLFHDDDEDYRGAHGDQWSGRSGSSEHRNSRYDREQGSGVHSDWGRSPRNFSSHQDDHY